MHNGISKPPKRGTNSRSASQTSNVVQEQGFHYPDWSTFRSKTQSRQVPYHLFTQHLWLLRDIPLASIHAYYETAKIILKAVLQGAAQLSNHLEALHKLKYVAKLELWARFVVLILNLPILHC